MSIKLNHLVANMSQKPTFKLAPPGTNNSVFGIDQ